MSTFRTDWGEMPAEKEASKGTSIEVICERLGAYFDANRKEFLCKNAGGRWLHHTTSDFRMLLRKNGVRVRAGENENVSPGEEVICWLKDHRDVRYASPLAGRKAGFYSEGGVRLLVTDSPKLIEAKQGDWSTLHRLLEGLLASDVYGKRQMETFFGWVKFSIQALRSGKSQPGQVLVLAGPVQCGKSLLQMLLTQILGGRAAKPWRYIAGRTEFNADLFQAEHLMIEDEQASTDLRTRISLAGKFKEIAVNEAHSCHGKNKDAVLLRPFWRLSVSVNDEPENLLVLPPLTSDISDKVMLLKCTKLSFITSKPATSYRIKTSH